MTRYDKTRFRITGYPGTAIPLAEIELEALGQRWLSGPYGSVIPSADVRRERPPTLGESYLELASIDLESEREIHDFIDRWSILGVRWYQDPVTLERVEGADYTHLFGGYLQRDFFGEFDPDEEDSFVVTDPLAEAVQVTIDELIEAVADADQAIELTAKELPKTEETIEEFRVGASLIRDFVKVWEWQAGSEPPEAWESSLHGPNDLYSLDEATQWLSSWATPLLGPFHPQFQVLEEYPDGQLGAAPPYYRDVPLLNVMALEFYNHTCEGAVYKTCANERCGRLFVRQHGRANHGQHRTTGVKYCSAECARAQAQRQYRRRKNSAVTDRIE